jgi:excisionase family DNA binding protein
MTPDPNPAIPDDKLALRPREAARLLGVSQGTLKMLTQTRGLPHIKLDRAVLYPVDGLRQWLAEQAAIRASKQ